MDREHKLAKLAILKARVSALEQELDYPTDLPPVVRVKLVRRDWFMSPLFLGLVAAATSLAVNIVGAALAGKHVLELLRIYLTLPLGSRALELTSGQDDFVLFAGCCLYLATGMLGGVPVYWILKRVFAGQGFATRAAVATALGVAIWLFNYHVVLAWVQPWLQQGNWIVALVPWYVAAATHICFVWTIFAVTEWGRTLSDEPFVVEPRNGACPA